jgi:hypothetical protein
MTMPPLRSDADAKAKDEKIRDDEIEDSNTDAQDLDDFVQGFRDGMCPVSGDFVLNLLIRVSAADIGSSTFFPPFDLQGERYTDVDNRVWI